MLRNTLETTTETKNTSRPVGSFNAIKQRRSSKKDKKVKKRNQQIYIVGAEYLFRSTYLYFYLTEPIEWKYESKVWEVADDLERSVCYFKLYP